MNFFNQRVVAADCTRQRVANHRMVHKLPVIQAGLAITLETVETDHMTLQALEDQDHTHDIGAGDAGHASGVGHDEVEGHRKVII